MFARSWLLAVLIALAGCGEYSRPFAGNPGATARRLSDPPPARLAVPPPAGALLTDAASLALAIAVADALVVLEVPAFADDARRGDWRLVIGARTEAAGVVPTYSVQNPKGEEQGATQGSAFTPAAWSAAAEATIKAAAVEAGAKVAALLVQIEAARRQNDPNSLINRPARVWFTGVKGAPGDGNDALARQMRLELPRLGTVLQDSEIGADFTLGAEVTSTPMAGNQVRIEIQWIVKDLKGEERAKIVQLNELKRGTLDGFWGEVAAVVAREAAGGIKDALLTQAGVRK